MPAKRKRSCNIGVYPRVLGFPFTLGLTLLGVIIASILVAILTLNWIIAIIPPVLCSIIVSRIKKKYGDFYAQRAKIFHYERLTTKKFMANLSHDLLEIKRDKHDGTNRK